MFIDTTIRSKGHLTVRATARGSYGETSHRQFGPAYRHVDAALKCVERLIAQGMRGVEMYNLNTHHVDYFGK